MEDIEINERKKKQNYLIKNIIEKGYDPDEFTEFLHSKRTDGENIDNWSLEELETMVLQFKKETAKSDNSEKLNFKLEELELTNSQEIIYINRISTAKKKKTILSEIQPHITIDNIEIKEGSLFSGKYLCFTVTILELEIKVIRTDSDFKWLYECMAKEFPFIPLPPMLPAYDKNFNSKTTANIKRCFEKFLNESLKHSDLKNSLSLEIFFVSQSKEEMSKRSKDFQIFLNKNLMINKGFTKKGFENLSKNALNLYPTTEGYADLKISPMIRNFINCSEGKFYHYDILFDRLNKLCTAFDKQQKKMILLNSKIKETFSELQSTAIKFNSAKLFRNRYNVIEDSLYSAIVSHFENYGRVIR